MLLPFQCLYVSILQVLQKDLGLFVSIRSSKVPFNVLKQVLDITLLVKEKVSMKSHSNYLYPF